MDREIRYVERVRSALGIAQALRSPPRATERNGTTVGWIPALKFPTWMRCLKCGLLHPAPWRAPRGAGRCWGHEEGSGACSGRLEQVPWVLVHEEGYLADVPWHDLAHAAARDPARRQCRHDWTEPYLRLRDTPAGRRITCDRCRSSENLSSGSPPRTAFPSGAWQQPWFRERPAQSPAEPAWVMDINDVRVHYPMTRTALVIPPGVENPARHGPRPLVREHPQSGPDSERSEQPGTAGRSQTARHRVSLHPRADRGRACEDRRWLPALRPEDNGRGSDGG